MKLSLSNDADLFACQQVTGLQTRSVVAAIANYITARCPETEDAEVVVNKRLLPDSYKSNPSQMAIVVLSKLHEFSGCRGFRDPLSDKRVILSLSREPRPANEKWSRAKPSMKVIIKEWLDLALPRSKKLTIPIEAIPEWYITHTEQLVYLVKEQTGIKVKILKLAKNWLIQRS